MRHAARSTQRAGRTRGAALVLLTVTTLLICPAHVIARSLAMPSEASAEPARRSTLLIWDKRTLTEHLVVQAPAIRDGGSSSTFTRRMLVATPSRPDLASCDEDVFDQLRETFYPTPIPEPGTRGVVLYSMLWANLNGDWPIKYAADTTPSYYDDGEGSVPPLPPPHKLQRAGYRTAELDARNPGKLAAWLKSHEFDTQTALDWVQPYVAKRWTITAVEGRRAS